MPTPITIRAARAYDFAPIYAINAAASPGVSTFAAGEVERVAATAKHFWVSELDGAAVGYLAAYAHDARYDGEEFTWFQSRLRSFLYIDQVAIALSARRRGIAALLYGAVEAAAIRDDFTSLTCEVNEVPANPDSMAFHLSQGFTVVDRLQTRDGRLVQLFCKRLGSAGIRMR
jgi:predicted GNAT superfamily acetyltransferase